MSAFVSTDAKSQRGYVPTTALAKSVDFDEDTDAHSTYLLRNGLVNISRNGK